MKKVSLIQLIVTLIFVIKRVFILLILLVSVPNLVVAEVELADGIKYLEPEIRIYIEKRAREEDESKHASPYVSKIVRGDINGDQKEDVFVSYAIEGIGGGNFSMYYQALFLKERGRIIFKAERCDGSFGTAQGESYIPIRIERGKVLCEILAYAPGDGVCCPSLKGKGEILFKGGKLVAIKTKSNLLRKNVK